MTSLNGNIFRVTGNFCAGNSPVPAEFPTQGQWRGALMFSLICVWINDWVNNREAVDLRRYRAYYDVIVMHLDMAKWWPSCIFDAVWFAADGSGRPALRNNPIYIGFNLYLICFCMTFFLYAPPISLTTRLFVHVLRLLDNKGNPKAAFIVSFLGVSTDNWRNLSTKGGWRRKCFHLRTSL